MADNILHEGKHIIWCGLWELAYCMDRLSGLIDRTFFAFVDAVVLFLKGGQWEGGWFFASFTYITDDFFKTVAIKTGNINLFPLHFS